MRSAKPDIADATIPKKSVRDGGAERDIAVSQALAALPDASRAQRHRGGRGTSSRWWPLARHCRVKGYVGHLHSYCASSLVQSRNAPSGAFSTDAHPSHRRIVRARAPHARCGRRAAP
jgi:hypothetical protein